MNLLILIAMGLFIFGQKVRTNWVSGIKSTLTKLFGEGTDKRLFSGFTASPISFIRNTKLWARVFNWSGTAAGINGLGGVGGGTLISRRHVLLADHVPYPARPFEIFFVNQAGKTLAYKVIKVDSVSGTDIAIGTLDRDVDASLPVYRVLPEGWEQRVAGVVVGTGMGSPVITLRLPVLFTNQDRFALTGDVTKVVAGLANVDPPTFEGAQSYYMNPRGGDSGNPIFTLIGDELILLGAWYRVGGFPWLIDYRKQVEAIIGQPLLVARIP